MSRGLSAKALKSTPSVTADAGGSGSRLALALLAWPGRHHPETGADPTVRHRRKAIWIASSLALLAM